MKIMMVVPSFPEPSEAFTIRQARGLRAVVCPLRFNPEQPKPAGIEICRLPEPGYTMQGRTRIEKARLVYNFLRRGNPERLPAAAEKDFRAGLEEVNPDLVLAQYGPTGLLVMEAALARGVPLAVHFHGFDISSLYCHRIYRRAYRRLLRRAAGLVVVNEIQRRRLLTLGGEEKKIRVIPCGVPVAEFLPSTEVARQPCRFLAVGRLTEKKSPINTIRAFARCAAACDGVTLTFIGDGPLFSSCVHLAEELGVANLINFLGAQGNERVRAEMAAAGAFVQHSLTAANGDEEGWPVAVAEAMAAGLPVVATRHTGILEQVKDGESGYLVDEGNWETMAERLIALARNPEQRQRFGRAGREHIAREGDAERCINNLRNFLREVSLGQAPSA